jgi:hypothetical protein
VGILWQAPAGNKGEHFVRNNQNCDAQPAAETSLAHKSTRTAGVGILQRAPASTSNIDTAQEDT